MAVNNEIGVIQPLKEIGELCRSRKIFFHTDGAQALGKVPVDVNEMKIDLMSISGHKFYGPKASALFTSVDVREFEWNPSSTVVDKSEVCVRELSRRRSSWASVKPLEWRRKKWSTTKRTSSAWRSD